MTKFAPAVIEEVTAEFRQHLERDARSMAPPISALASVLLDMQLDTLRDALRTSSVEDARQIVAEIVEEGGGGAFTAAVQLAIMLQAEQG